jgi:hypothetical protein
LSPEKPDAASTGEIPQVPRQRRAENVSRRRRSSAGRTSGQQKKAKTRNSKQTSKLYKNHAYNQCYVILNIVEHTPRIVDRNGIRSASQIRSIRLSLANKTMATGLLSPSVHRKDISVQSCFLLRDRKLPSYELSCEGQN